MGENSLTSLPRFLSEGLFSSLVGTPNKAIQLPVSSRPFYLLVQNVNSASSKFEEEQRVKHEMQTVKENLSQPGLTVAQIRDCLCRVIYCHMLGYDVSWSHIHALKLAQQGSSLEKRIGYLAACLMLHRNAQVVLLLTSTMLKDLSSSNILENMNALSAASQLASGEVIPFLLQRVLELLKHPRELVRQKAVMCLYQFQLLAPDLLEHNCDDLQRALFDKDPSVMAAAVHALKYQVMRNPENYESTGQSLLDILRQIIDRKMSSVFEYHSIQLPWLQIQILQCLSTLVVHHEILKHNLCLLMREILQKLNVKENMGFAILYECICCIIAMKPEGSLLDEAAQHVGRLLRSSEPNLKYIGVKALMQLVQADSQYAMNYQSLIVDSLENEEVNIQKKMYKVLYQIANKTNVETVCSKLLKYFSMTTDRYWRSEVIEMVIDLADRYPVSADWQIQTILSCVQQGGELCGATIVKKVLDILEREYIIKTDTKGQQVLVQKSVSCMLMTNATPALLHIASWVLGELCVLLQKMPEDRVISLLTKHLCDPDLSFPVKSSLVSALQKLLMNQIISHVTMVDRLAVCLENQHFVIKQRLVLLQKVCKEKLVLEKYNPNDIDTTLTFLDEHVSQYLESGGTPYLPPHLRKSTTVIGMDEAKLFQGTSTPEAPGSNEGRVRSHSRTSSNKTTEEDEPGIKIGAVKKVWGRHGRLTEESQGIDSMTQNVPLSPNQKEKSELVTALFSGITSPDKHFPSSNSPEPADSEAGFQSHVSDDAAWRSALSNLSLQSTEQTPNSQVLISTTDIEIPRIGNSGSGHQALLFDTTEMLEMDESSPQNSVNGLSKNGCENLYLNRTGLDPLVNTDCIIDPRIGELGNSLESTNESYSDALSSLLEDNSSFLNISVSSTDQNQVLITHTKSDGVRTKTRLNEGNNTSTEYMDLNQGVVIPDGNKTDDDIQSIYSEDKSYSLYDDDDDEDDDS